MKRLLPFVLLSAACATPAVRVAYQPTLDRGSLVKPVKVVLTAADNSGGVRFSGPETVPVERTPGEALRDALIAELKQAGAALAQPGDKDAAQLSIALEESKLSWEPKMKTTVRAQVRLRLSLTRGGADLWSGDLSGAGEIADFNSRHHKAANKALNVAFQQAVEQVGPLVAEALAGKAK